MLLKIVVIFILLFLCNVACGQNVDTDYVLQHLANDSYDARVRPPNSINGTSHPVNVEVNMYLRSMARIDFVSMSYELQLTFRETWKDPRLAYEHLAEHVPDYITLTDTELIWRPDTFFQNEKSAHRHDIDRPNILVRVYRDGRVLFSERITLTVACPMNLQLYPMDVQKCYLYLASYAFTTDDIVYSWRENTPHQLHPDLRLSLPSFHLSSVDASSSMSITNTGSYSSLRTTFTLTREFGYYLLQVYAPSCLLVIVSWVSFWLDRNAVPARVTLGVTTLLTVTTQIASINNKLPAVSYVKAIDIWCGGCLFFIFGAVLEFAYVSYIASQIAVKEGKKCAECKKTDDAEKQEPAAESSQNRRVEAKGAPLLSDDSIENNKKKNDGLKSCFIFNQAEKVDEAKLIDIRARVLFPLAFIIFNILYWFFYFPV